MRPYPITCDADILRTAYAGLCPAKQSCEFPRHFIYDVRRYFREEVFPFFFQFVCQLQALMCQDMDRIFIRL